MSTHSILTDAILPDAFLSIFQPILERVTDPLFQVYGLGAAAVLSAAGALLLVLRSKLGDEGFAKVWATYRSWWIMIPLVLAVVALGRTAVIVALALVAALGVREFASATGLARDRWMSATVYIGVAAVALLSWLPDPRLDGQGWYGMFMALPVYVVAAILTVPVLRNRHAGQLQRIGLALAAFIYFGWMFGHLGFLANAEAGMGYLLYLCFAVVAGDVAAYTFGRLFGRHALRDQISPNKTLEGALGSAALSMLLPFLLRFSFPDFSLVQLLLTGLIVGVGGQLGDLTISTFKRDLGIKDMGASIPGHGGVLDRVDSLIFVAPLFFHMVRWTEGLA